MICEFILILIMEGQCELVGGASERRALLEIKTDIYNRAAWLSSWRIDDTGDETAAIGKESNATT